MLQDTCEWLAQGYGMERGAKDTWQSAVATWNGISVPLFPLLGSAAEEDGVPILCLGVDRKHGHTCGLGRHTSNHMRGHWFEVWRPRLQVCPCFLSTPRYKNGTPSSSAAEPSSKAEASRKLRLWHQALQTAPAATGWRSTGLEIPAASTADEGPLAPHGGPPPHSNSAVAPGAPKAARRRRLPASFQSSFVILTLRGSIVKLGLALKVYLKFI